MKQHRGVILGVVASLSLFLLPGIAPMAQEGWRTPDGQALPDTADRKSKQGFAGMVLVTPDADWAEKWDTPPEVTPDFAQADTVRQGGELHVLIFFSGAKLDPGRRANITCAIKVTRPDQSLSTDQANLPCHQGPLGGDSGNLHLAGPTLKFIAEPNDLPGKWTVNIVLRDNERGVSLPLETSFTLLE